MLRIDGHTDNERIKVSGWKDNMELSQERARAVWVALRGMGLAPETMCANGYGEFHPVADNRTAAGRAQNRRVELSLVAITTNTPTLGGATIGGDTKSTLIGPAAGAGSGYIIGNEADKPDTTTP